MGVDAGPVIARWVSRIATVPVAGTMCADVPEPPTQPYRPGTFQGCSTSTSTDPPKPQPCPSRNSELSARCRASRWSVVITPDGLRRQQRFAAGQQHPPEGEPVVGGRHQAPAAGRERRRCCDRAVRRVREHQAVAVRAVGGRQPAQRRLGDVEPRVAHPERLEHPLREELRQRLPDWPARSGRRGCRSRCCRATPRPAGAAAGPARAPRPRRRAPGRRCRGPRAPAA